LTKFPPVLLGSRFFSAALSLARQILRLVRLLKRSGGLSPSSPLFSAPGFPDPVMLPFFPIDGKRWCIRRPIFPRSSRKSLSSFAPFFPGPPTLPSPVKILSFPAPVFEHPRYRNALGRSTFLVFFASAFLCPTRLPPPLLFFFVEREGSLLGVIDRRLYFSNSPYGSLLCGIGISPSMPATVVSSGSFF